MADSCAAVRLQAELRSRPAAPRRSIEAPPRQVIGFNVSPKPQFRDEAAVIEQLHGSCPQYIISPRSATSPRSVLQELLDQSPNKFQPATSTPPSDQNPTGNHRNPFLHLSSSPRASTNQKRPGGHEHCQLHCASTAAVPPSMLHDNIHGKSSISEEADGVLLTYSSKDHSFRDDKEGLKSLEHAQNSSIFNRSNFNGGSGHGEKGILHLHHLEKSRKSDNVQNKAKKNSLFTFVAMSSSPSANDYCSDNGYHDDRTGIINNMDFLSSCHLCRRSLGQGQDVFMYSGDKAFCSMECRYQQIIIDERKERCPPSIIRSGPDRQSQDLTYSKSKLTMAHQYSHKATSSHYPNTAAAA